MWTPLVVRVPLAVAGMIAAWFVPRESIRFELVQTGIALAMLAIFIVFLWNVPRIWRLLRRSKIPGDDLR